MSEQLWAKELLPYGQGHRAPRGGLCDLQLLELLREYRRSIAKRYRVIEQDLLERLLPEGDLWISSKLDGELWYLVKRGAEVALCAYNGRVLLGTALLKEAAQRLAKAPDLVLAGELIAPPDTGRPRVQHVASALASATDDRLRFYAFDLVQEGAESALSVPYPQRFAKLRGWLEGGDRVGVVTTVVGSRKEAASYYREWVGTQRFEGIVVRGELGITYKIKPTFSIDAVVIAFGTRITTGTPQLREMTVALRRDDGTLQVLGSVGGGFAEPDRIAWHERLSKLVVPSSFRMANRDGTLCKFVRPEIVVEIQCTDLVDSDADDLPITRMRLAYGEEGYAAVGTAPIAAMLFPVFLRERADKVPDAANVGMDQVTSRLSLEEAGPALGTEIPTAVVVERKAFVKGESAVRKYVILETRKSGGTYPPYVAYFTDYSGGRAEPLKTSLRPCSTLDIAHKYVASWLEENVKRGWLEAGTAASAPAPAAKSKPKKAPAGETAATTETAPTPAAPSTPTKKRRRSES